tara:strand:- start:103 stop:366 length:264 start_codon:yes stop_codon:yes gene_type:complete
MNDFEGEQLDLEYPCHWEYRVIGADLPTLERAVQSVMADKPYTCKPGNTSEGGRWCTLVVSLEVVDEGERVGLYRALQARDDIKIVL